MKDNPVKPASGSSLIYLGSALIVGMFAVGLSETGRHGPIGPAVPIKPVDHEKVAAIVKGTVPKIVAVKAKHDFGKVREGDKVVHVFKVRNEGKGELVIEKAKGS